MVSNTAFSWFFWRDIKKALDIEHEMLTNSGLVV